MGSRALAIVGFLCYIGSMIPINIRPYFWEVNTKKLDPKKRPEYIISRLLEYGKPDAIRWAWREFSKKEWRRALKLREVSKKSRNFWASLLSEKQ